MVMVAAVVVGFMLLLGTCFMLIQWKTMGPRSAEWEVRREQLERSPVSRAEIIRALIITAVIYGSLGVAFYVGWRLGGIEEGVTAAVLLATVGALALAGFVIKTAWVRRR